MPQLFKNFIATTNTTGSAVTFLECPAGKTLIVRSMTSFNDNASTATQKLHLLDASESTSDTIIFGDPDGYSITSKNAVIFTLNRFVLEEGDKIGFETDVNAQRISGSFVLLDSSSRTRYKHISKKVTTEDSFVSLITAPAGHTVIVKTLVISNISGTNATGSDNEIRLVEAATNTFVPIAQGTLNNNSSAQFQTSTFVLEPGDSIQSRFTEQPYTATVFYQELPTPTIRGQ